MADSTLEMTKSEEKFPVNKSVMKFLLYPFLIITFGLCVSFLWQKFSMLAFLSFTLCELERDFGLYNIPHAMCSNF